MRTILFLLVGALAVSACGSGGSDDGRVQVVASFFPLADAAQQVGGPDVEVQNLTGPGVEPHDLEVTTDQVDAIEDADLVVLMGQGFQPAVEGAAERRDGGTIAVLDELEVTGADPHVWLDPVRMRDVVADVAAALTDVVPPGQRAGIRRRAAAFDAVLAALDGRYRTGLAGCRSRTIVTAHAAFGWLARRYDLTDESIAGLSPDQEPDPRRLAELADLVRRAGVEVVFTEVLVSPKLADTLAREAGVRTDVLDPLESRPAGGGGYVAGMDRNLTKLRSALGCR